MSNKKLGDQLKKGISPQELESFVRNHTPEVFSTVAIFVSAASSMFDFFSGPAWSILFAAIGAIFALLFPEKVDRKLKRFYHFTINQEKTTEMVLGGVKLVVAIFLPFIFFCFLGLLAGVSYHFYIRHAQITEPEEVQARKKR
ncbi:MAG TPA: hypothetical protein VLE96_03325 [Chlamydiales bacterium]|nr:hypothetical protein [Chlamydiales bacterium]